MAHIVAKRQKFFIQQPTNTEILSLVREAIDLGLSVYQQSLHSPETIQQFRQHVLEVAGNQLLTQIVHQPSDGITWRATDPNRSQHTAESLARNAKEKDVLFIALAHGGVAAGMDSYLRYCDLVGSKDSRFYVVRYSSYKMKDGKPRLSPEEIRYLQTQALGKRIIIFDEDRASGHTLESAQLFFRTEVFPSQSITAVTNLDARSELAALGGEKTSIINQFYSYQLSNKMFNKTPPNLHYFITDMYKNKISKASPFKKFLSETKSKY